MKANDLSQILKPIETTSVNKHSGELTGSDNYNDHIRDPWNAIQVLVYETSSKYHFLVQGMNEHTMKWNNYKAYSCDKTNLMEANKIAKALMESPNWLDWDTEDDTKNIEVDYDKQRVYAYGYGCNGSPYNGNADIEIIMQDYVDDDEPGTWEVQQAEYFEDEDCWSAEIIEI